MSSGAADGARAGLADAFADMPLVLKGVTSFFVVFGGGSVLLAIVPGTEHRVAGQALTTGELWAVGLAPFSLLLGAWLLASAFGLLRRATPACWGVVMAYALFVPAELLLAEAPRVPLQAGLAMLWAGASWAYLFRTRASLAFFSRHAGAGE